MTSKLKVPCCVELKGLEKYQVLEIEDIFVKLGAGVCDSAEEFSPDFWKYYGVEDDNTTQFYDRRGSYSEDDNDSDVTLYTLEELRALVVEDQASPETPSDGWIEWNGGARPVAEATIVETKYRGWEGEIQPAGNLRWYWAKEDNGCDEGVDIIAYRIIAKQEALGDVSEQPTTMVLPEADSSCNQGKSLVEVVRNLSYTVTIKGVEFELTDEEYQELINQLEDGM